MSETKVLFAVSYKTVHEKYTLMLHGSLWMQVLSQIVSVPHNPEFQKKLLDGLDINDCHECRFFVHSVQQTAMRI